jgi:hypothetical protein
MNSRLAGNNLITLGFSVPETAFFERIAKIPVSKRTMGYLPFRRLRATQTVI